MSILYVTGIHHVGKSTLCKYLSEMFSVPHYSASEIIKNALNFNNKPEKYNSEIEYNAKIFKESVLNLDNINENIIIDGHTVLLNEDCKPYSVNMSIFNNLPIECVVLLIGDVNLLVSRFINACDFNVSKVEINHFQELEIINTIKLVSTLSCNIVIINSIDEPYITFNRISKIWGTKRGE